MKDGNKNDGTYETIEIMENATIIYNDEDRAIFKAIFIKNKREVIFGQVFFVEDENLYYFSESGGIPRDNIKSIVGGTKKFVLKK